MHTGINTGLVVTGDVNLEKGIHGVAGDAINVAARLSDLGNADDILVASGTYSQSQGYFDFKELEPATIKGKSEPIRIFKVLSVKEQPVKIHRLDGFKSALIGRKVEMGQMAEAVDFLKQGKGSTISICGTAGTGKSRLVADFKDSLDLDEIQWLEGHAYPYSQNIPYHPLIDLLNRAMQIEEDDTPDKIREKVDTGISALSGNKDDIIPYIGSLFSLDYPEIEKVSPEFWKTQLHKAVQTILFDLSRRAPTVICLEDLHWADPSFLELIRVLLSNSREPILFLCIYRPLISLFTSHQIDTMANPYHDIRLQDLSPTESYAMVESLLKSDSIPVELQRFIREKVEGNPFYIEEVINSLIETKTLIRDNGLWKITRPITESDISSTIHGVISGRIDRLEKETKRILQEASVIGRAFLYEILNKITKLDDRIDGDLSILERIDLIKTRTVQPDLEYMFKHALTQEVVYNGLIKKERQEIHQQIALVMEQLFHDRLPEFYETLAFHFRQGRSIGKAVDYLIKSGVKSLNRFSLDEAHQHYQQAYDLLSSKLSKNEEDNNLLFDLLEKWALVYYYYGKFRDLITLFRAHEAVAESLEDKGRPGMFYAWMGMALWAIGKSKDSYRYLRKALKLGEEAGNPKVIGYACTWLPLACIEIGIMDEGIEYGERAKRIAEELPSDQYLYFKPRGDLGFLYYCRGDSGKALKTGKEMIEYGEKHSNIRSQAMGHAVVGWGYLASGDFEEAINSLYRVEKIAVDPFYATVWSCFRAYAHFYAGQFQESETALRRAEKCLKTGFDALEEYILLGWGLLWISKGRIGKGINILNAARQLSLRNEWKFCHALSEYILGKVYLGMALGEGDVNLSTMLKNLGFLLKTIPFAARRAETHFRKAIEAFREIGVKGTLASAHLDLGRLHRAKGRIEQAREHIDEAIQLFEDCEAIVFLKQAREALESLS
jgi:tetratricopeptide (TPR) repeat protein